MSSPLGPKRHRPQELTPEQKKARSAQTMQRRRERVAAMTPEERRAYNQRNCELEKQRMMRRAAGLPPKTSERDAFEANRAERVLLAQAVANELPMTASGGPRKVLAHSPKVLKSTLDNPFLSLFTPTPEPAPVALVPARVSGVPDHVTAKLSPIDKALFTFFTAHREECCEYEDERAKWAARKVVGDGSTHMGAAAFLYKLECRYPTEQVVMYGAPGYPAACTLAVTALGTLGYRVLALEKWLGVVRDSAVGSLPPVESDEADSVFGMILEQLARGKLLPEIAFSVGWSTLAVGRFVRDYGKKYPESRLDVNMAHDLGLQTVTTAIADAMDEQMADEKLTALSVAVLQSRLANFRALAVRLAGSAYAAPAAQKTQVNVTPTNSGMKIDVSYRGGADDDILDVLAHVQVDR